jgi:hypothetical protein
MYIATDPVRTRNVRALRNRSLTTYNNSNNNNNRFWSVERTSEGRLCACRISRRPVTRVQHNRWILAGRTFRPFRSISRLARVHRTRLSTSARVRSQTRTQARERCYRERYSTLKHQQVTGLVLDSIWSFSISLLVWQFLFFFFLQPTFFKHHNNTVLLVTVSAERARKQNVLFKIHNKVGEVVRVTYARAQSVLRIRPAWGTSWFS